MQSHFDTVDPKFLDLRQFPLPLTRHDLSIPVQHESAKAQCRNDGFVEEDIDLSGGGNENAIYIRRSSSTDQLDMLGPFELSKSNSSSTNASSVSTNGNSIANTNTEMYSLLS